MTTINCDFPLNIEHYYHIPVEPNQSSQWSRVSFPNPLLLCLHSFCFQAKEKEHGWWASCGKNEWIKLEYLMDPYNPGSSIPNSLKFQWWSPRGVDQVGDDLPWYWELDAHEGTCWQDQDVSDFVEGSITWRGGWRQKTKRSQTLTS
jgi:hypothetical protein